MTAGEVQTGNHLRNIREAMERARADLVVIGPSANLRYAIGFDALAVDRITCLLVTASSAVMILPDFDVAEFVQATGFHEVAPWSDKRGPIGPVSDAFERLDGLGPNPSVLIDETLPFAFANILRPHLGPRPAELADDLFASLRMVKTPEEIELLASAGEVASVGIDFALEAAKPGMTELQLQAATDQALRAAGAEQVLVVLIAAGAGASSPHHQAGRRVINSGEAVLIDHGVRVDGYYGDITQQVFLGKPTDEYRRVYATVFEAQEAGFQAALVGASPHDVDHAASRVINAAGYGEWNGPRTGHGIGLDIHEAPSVVEGNHVPMAEGTVITVEPGVYIPGKFGIRIEDMVAVTASGPRRLTRGSRPLHSR